MVNSWFLGPSLRLNSVELSLLLAPPLGVNSLLCCACYLRTMCLLSASFLRHFSLAVAGLRAPLSRFLEGALYKYPEWINEWLWSQVQDLVFKSHLWVQVLRGHPFMTSTWRGGGQAQVDGEGVCTMWTSTQKIYSPLMSSGLLLMQRSWVFLSKFCLWME